MGCQTDPHYSSGENNIFLVLLFLTLSRTLPLDSIHPALTGVINSPSPIFCSHQFFSHSFLMILFYCGVFPYRTVMFCNSQHIFPPEVSLPKYLSSSYCLITLPISWRCCSQSSLHIHTHLCVLSACFLITPLMRWHHNPLIPTLFWFSRSILTFLVMSQNTDYKTIRVKLGALAHSSQ